MAARPWFLSSILLFMQDMRNSKSGVREKCFQCSKLSKYKFFMYFHQRARHYYVLS